uniref:Thioredoxin domain-containing protein n=1 Tax=Panagrolaimus sp. JU765 TaxID=591449 RepID=A0AC34QDD5_9BILA
MLNTMKSLFLFVCIYKFVQADVVDDIFKPLSVPDNPISTCAKHNLFVYSALKQCPVVDDTCCLNLYLRDPEYKNSLTCTLVGPFPNNSLHILNSTDFLKLVAQRDSCTRPWCMISLMYSKSCIFSAKVAERFEELASIFPHLMVTAVDVSSKDGSMDTLISHYGIAATPVLVLWENGLPRYKVTEEPGNFDAVVQVLQNKSDLFPAKNWTKDTCLEQECPELENVIPVNKSNRLRQAFIVDEQMQSFDWYMLMAVIGLILQGLYVFEARRQNGIPWKNLEFGF